jgi:hypothetical protein
MLNESSEGSFEEELEVNEKYIKCSQEHGSRAKRIGKRLDRYCDCTETASVPLPSPITAAIIAMWLLLY